MELKKRKYKKLEVEQMLSSVTSEYDERIRNLNDEIVELAQKVKKLSAELDVERNKEKLVGESIINATKSSNELEQSAKLKYSATYLTLKKFSDKWKEYFEFVSEKYPYYQSLKQSAELRDRLVAILNAKMSDQEIENLSKELDTVASATSFDPKSKVQDYISATSDNGFNLDEVLNPGVLRLEDLCKELGLIEEE